MTRVQTRSSEKRSRGVAVTRVEFRGQPFAERHEIEAQGNVFEEALVGAEAPRIHACEREDHLPGHIADRAGLILAQTWLAVASDLFHQSTEAGRGLLAQMITHAAPATAFTDCHTHPAPPPPPHPHTPHPLRPSHPPRL